MITLTNDFHNKKARVRPDSRGIVSARAMRRAMDKLCGCDCQCGGIRGRQAVEILQVYPDGAHQFAVIGSRITHAIVQHGYAVFGVGSSRAEAVADAAKWLEDEHGRQGGLTAGQVEAQIVARPSDGDLCVLTEEDDEFDGYMASQGGFVKRDYVWYKE